LPKWGYWLEAHVRPHAHDGYCGAQKKGFTNELPWFAVTDPWLSLLAMICRGVQQVLTSANWGGVVGNFMTGGLNLQVIAASAVV
jgi:hypothetical protein